MFNMTTNFRNTTPPWPSLYNPGIEIVHIEHNSPIQFEGAYLYRAADVFRFTLYWTLIFYTPIFLVCGLYAFWNYSFPPPQQTIVQQEPYPLSPLRQPFLHRQSSPQPIKTPKFNERRSRITFALIVLFTFLLLSVAGAVIGSAIMGFVTAGLFKAGNFNMSTWIPFLLAIMQVVIGLLSIWPSVVEII